MSSAASKDTIYIDVDDEITNIIEKVRGSDQKIVALVLPKRAAVLQSVVNMKLLKRSADTAKKRVVLITSESSLMPLAGAVGLYVAKNMQTKPVIPAGPDMGALPDSVVSDDGVEVDEPVVDGSKSVGELAGPSRGASPKVAALSPEDEPIEVDNDDVADTVAAATASKAAKKSKGAKKFKIPNFEKFRVLLVLGGLAFVLLLVGLYFAIFVMPKARITIKTDSTTVNSNISFTASTTAQEFDKDAKVIPAKRQEVKKTETEKVAASGQKDVGTKASGTIVVTNCGASKVEIPAGTGFSSGNFTFISQESVSVPKSGYDFTGSGFVCKNDGTETVSVVAQRPGDTYNLDARTYQIANAPNNTTAKGSAMTGGVSKIVKIVSQSDVDSAKQKLATKTGQAVNGELKDTLTNEGMLPLEETYVAGEPAITTTPNVGDEAAEVTVTSIATYTMLGIKQDDVKVLVEEDAKRQIDTAKQTILDNGLKDASYVIQDAKKDAPQVKITVQSVVKAGPQLDIEGIKREVAGKKKGEAANIIQSRPAIKEVTVELSPFWVTKTPKKPSKITILFDQPDKNAKP